MATGKFKSKNDENYAFSIDDNLASLSETAKATGSQPQGGIIDMGATRHFSTDQSSMQNYAEINPKPIKAVDGRTFQAIGQGDLVVRLPNGDNETTVTLKDTLYAPSMPFTLISVSRLNKAGFSLHVKNGLCKILSPTRRVITQIPETHGLYHVENRNEHALSAKAQVTLTELHQLMGHISPQISKQPVHNGVIEGIDLDMTSEAKFCVACTHVKSSKVPVPKERSSEHEVTYRARIHTDVWGPAQTHSLRGKQYYVSFTDDSSRESRLAYLKKKSEAFNTYKKYEARVKEQRGATIKVLQSDRGGEYISDAFEEHLDQQGTVQKLTVHDTLALLST